MNSRPGWEPALSSGGVDAVTEVTHVVEIFGNGVYKIYLVKIRRPIAETLCIYGLQLQLHHIAVATSHLSDTPSN